MHQNQSSNSDSSDWETLTTSWFSEDGIRLDLHTASSIGDVEGVKQLLSSGADVNALNKGGWTPLMYAAYLGHENVCRLLFLFNDANHGLIIDKQSRDRGQSALMLTASCGNENTVALLLKNGASLTALDNRNRTALYYATENNHTHVIRQLLLAGADPNFPSSSSADQTDQYLTPFQLACSEGLDVIVNYFLHCGAADNGSAAESARSLALKNGHKKIVSLIDDYLQSVRNGKGMKLEDYQFSRSHDLLEGPNAVSSLMKLQARLTPSDSQLYEKQRQQTKCKQRQHKDDYEKTITSRSHARPASVDELLELLNLNKYSATFREHNVDITKLMTMNSDDLKTIGINLFGPRKKILNAIERWHQNVPLTGIL